MRLASYTVVTRGLLLDDGSLTVVLAQQLAALLFAVLLAGIASRSGISDIVLPQDAGTWALAAASGSVYYGLAFWFFTVVFAECRPRSREHSFH